MRSFIHIVIHIGENVAADPQHDPPHRLVAQGLIHYTYR
jgi:hypothetical protein